MGSSLNDFWPAVEAATPADPQPLLVCADWCAENGKASLCYALKWCAGKKRRPYRRGDVIRLPWLWMRWQHRYDGTSGAEMRRREPAVIPAPIFDESTASIYEISFGKSVDAYVALGFWLDRVRGFVEIPSIVVPPQPEIVSLGPLTCGKCGIMRARDVLDCPLCKTSEVRP